MALIMFAGILVYVLRVCDVLFHIEEQQTSKVGKQQYRIVTSIPNQTSIKQPLI